MSSCWEERLWFIWEKGEGLTPQRPPPACGWPLVIFVGEAVHLVHWHIPGLSLARTCVAGYQKMIFYIKTSKAAVCLDRLLTPWKHRVVLRRCISVAAEKHPPSYFHRTYQKQPQWWGYITHNAVCLRRGNKDTRSQSTAADQSV